MQQAIEISEDAFAAIFQPKRNHLDEHASFDWGDGFGTLFETFGEEFAHVQSQDPSCIWTLVECDGSQCVISGFHFVNRLGYFVTERPVADGVDIEVPLEDDLPPLTASQRTSLIEVLNYLADEELHYEACEDAEKPHHIWRHCVALRQLVDHEVPT
jgi:hypothetical protein